MPTPPTYIRNIIRQEDYAVIEVTPGGPQLLKCEQRADLYGYDWNYAGDVRQEGSEYIVCLAAPYDPETDSDIAIVGNYATQEEAIEKLWSLR